MKNENSGKHMLILGKIIAVSAALLSIIKVIPPNSVVLWICVIIGLILVFLGNSISNTKK